METKIRLTDDQRSKLREFRKNSCFAAEDISTELGFSKTWLGQIECGKIKTIKYNDLVRLINLITGNKIESDEAKEIHKQFLETGNRELTMIEILEIIHQEKLELEIYQALHEWFLNDIKERCKYYG